jgi:hypothetical protein
VYEGHVIFLLVRHDDDAFLLRVAKSGGPLSNEVRDVLGREAAFEMAADGAMFRKVERTAIDTALDELVSAARSLPQRQTKSAGEPDAVSSGISHQTT